MMLADYAEIQSVLSAEHSLTDAAEAHGTLTGSLCSAPGYRFEDWLLEILPDGTPRPPSAQTLQGLFRDTVGALNGAQMQFDLLLPDDGRPILERAGALALWCQGFLYGLGVGVLRDAANMPGELNEIVNDITEIGSAAVDTAESEESNESAYAELVEFIRVSVQVVFEELAPMREPPPSPGAPFH
jgi:hypothetical protein